MGASLRDSVEKLKQATSKLNKVTDEATAVVKTVETFLSKECNIGFETWVTVCADEPDEYNMAECTSISYSRWENKFRVIVSIGYDEDNNTTKPFGEWDRATKLLTVQKLPDLIEKIANGVENQFTETQKVTAAITDVLKAIDVKGGK